MHGLIHRYKREMIIVCKWYWCEVMTQIKSHSHYNSCEPKSKSVKGCKTTRAWKIKAVFIAFFFSFTLKNLILQHILWYY